MNRRELLRNTGAMVALAAGGLVLPARSEGKLALLQEDRDANVQLWLLQTGRASLGDDVYQHAIAALAQPATIG